MKFSKKLVSCLLVLCMLLSAIPAFAATVTTADGTGTIDTKNFPEGTIFIATNQLEYPGTLGTDYTVDTTCNYKAVVAMKNAAGYASSENYFVAPASGEYVVYAFRATHSNGGNRGSAAAVAGTSFTFTSDDYCDASVTGHKYFWCPADTPANITLTKNVLFSVKQELLSGHTSRMAALALVPADKVSALTATAGWTYNSDYLFTQDTLEALMAATTEKYTSSSVTVTVNGTSVEVTSGTASAAGATIRGTDLFGNVILAPTVADALAAATSPAADDEKYKDYAITSFANGVLSDAAVYVNNQLSADLDRVLLAAGDVITTKAYDSTNFAPIQLAASDSGLTRNVDGFSQRDTKGLPQLPIWPTLIKDLLPGLYDATGALNAGALNGCHFNGYLALRNPTSNAAFTGITSTWDYTNSKVYFENVELASVLNGNGDRIVGYAANSGVGKVVINTAALTNTDLVAGKNGNLYHPAYTVSSGGSGGYWNYMYANLYITNSSTNNDVKVVMSADGDKYALTTDGAQTVTILTVTYNADGTVSNAISDDNYVAFNAPYVGTVAANQKVYVWSARRYEGTNMSPVCEPILGTNFVD